MPGTVPIPKTLLIRHTGLRYVAPVSVILALCAAAEGHRPYRPTVVWPTLGPIFSWPCRCLRSWASVHLGCSRVTGASKGLESHGRETT